MSLLYTAQVLYNDVGAILLFIGIIGNTINIFIFSSVQNYRTTPCTFCFLVEAVNNILHLTINFITHIIIITSGINITDTSVVWCKIRYFLIAFLPFNSFTCSCLAVIDQFFVTSANIRLRQLSKIEWTHRIVFILSIFWFLLAISTNVVFFDISPITHICMPNNPAYALFFSMFVLIFFGVITILIMLIFGCLTYRNIHQTIILRAHQADRQLVKMIFTQAALVVISVTPYTVNGLYDTITNGMAKSPDRQQKEYLVTTVTNLLSYFYFSVCLYILFIRRILV